MRRNLVILLAVLISASSYAQSISKVIKYEDKKRDYFYYKTSYPVNENQIVSFFTFKETITVRLYDKDLNEIASKDIERQSKGNYSTNYYLSNKYLFYREKLKKSNVYKRVTLNEKLSAKSFADFGKPNFYVDLSEENYFYKVSKGGLAFKSVNFETKLPIEYRVSVAEGENTSVSDYKTFKDNNLVATTFSKSRGKESSYWVALHDKKGKELHSFNRMKDSKYKANVYFANDKDVVFVTGNYKENPSDDEIRSSEQHANKPMYAGVYLNKINTDKPFEKYYTYSDFKSLSSQIVKDKREKLLKLFRFCLEDVHVVNNEIVVVATIDEDSYGQTHDVLDNRYDKTHDGQEINYILVFGLNDSGELLWDKVITLDWKNHDKVQVGSFCDMNNFPNTVQCDKDGEVLKCHYAFQENITSFKIENGSISDKKDTPFELKTDHTQNLVEFQYKKSIYWYDNFFFNQDGIGKVLLLDKIEFK